MINSTERARELFLRAQDSLAGHSILTALRQAEEAAALDPTLAGVHAYRGECLKRLGLLDDALIAADAELKNDPASAVGAHLRRSVEEFLAQRDATFREPRRWETLLNDQIVRPIERATHHYTYRGRPMIKNPFDMALYPLLLWNTKPRTIFEVGSYNGTSALWMADTLATYGVDAHVHSVDVMGVSAIQDPRMTFYEGSGRELENVWTSDFIAGCPRPLLVIEDADHSRETTLAVLNYFHPHVRGGEYLVVEDGLSAQGPRDAIAEFLPAHASEWQVDAYYCDFFGYNATWCVNGFLKRIR